jgi:ketosteroid isomerase-like protein
MIPSADTPWQVEFHLGFPVIGQCDWARSMLKSARFDGGMDMNLNEIATSLVDGCRAGKDRENLDRLYAPDAVSVEAADFGDGREVVGVDAIKAKHDWWDSTFDVLDARVSDPMPHGDDRFAVTFDVKTRNKQSGAEEDMHEVAVYHVADGKITREEFFYQTG